MTRKLVLLLIWLAASAIAIAFAVLSLDSIAVDGSYVLANNDAFYHARRILDAALGERGFYQFDNMMHAPEGSWIAWPWGYDYVVACALQLALWFKPTLDPMQFLVYVTVAWLPVNVGLLLAITAILELRLTFRALIAVGFALLPLTQSLHRVGALDHHFIELTFVLLTCWLALRWFSAPASRLAGALCGISLGVAHAFHHGLFILQLPVLASLGMLWLRGTELPARPILAFAGSLIISTLLIGLPSAPLHDGQFSMSTLSWFHMYIALCTASLATFMALRASSRLSLLLIAALAAALVLPVLAEISLGARFLAGKLLLLDQILEMTSPLRMITGNWGIANTLGVYSGFLLLVPLLIVVFGYRAVVDKEALTVGFACFAVFGLGLLLLQYRLNYFGLAFMLIGPFYLLERTAWINAQKPLNVALAAIVVCALMLQPPLRGPLFQKYPLGGDHLYAQIFSLFAPLKEHCRKNPGIVAAASQFGHYIRFHADCSVIANNFLLTPLHSAKVDEVNGLFYLSPAELRATRPDVRYVLAFLSDAYEMQDGQVRFKSLDDIEQRNPALIVGLFFTPDTVEGYQVIGEVLLEVRTGQKIPLARLYEISRDANGARSP